MIPALAWWQITLASTAEQAMRRHTARRHYIILSTTLKRKRRRQDDRRPRQWLPQHHRWQTLRWPQGALARDFIIELDPCNPLTAARELPINTGYIEVSVPCAGFAALRRWQAP